MCSYALTRLTEHIKHIHFISCSNQNQKKTCELSQLLQSSRKRAISAEELSAESHVRMDGLKKVENWAHIRSATV
jgi:hypothetical protein